MIIIEQTLHCQNFECSLCCENLFLNYLFKTIIYMVGNIPTL